MDNIRLPKIQRPFLSVIARELVEVQPMTGFLSSLPSLNAMFGESTDYSLAADVRYDPENDMPEWYAVAVRNATQEIIDEMCKFCVKSFGKDGGENWMVRQRYRQFLFAHERDQTVFLLRWAK